MPSRPRVSPDDPARSGGWRPAALSALVYVALTALMGRHVIASLGTAVASDPGDPLLTAAILHWNTLNVPWSDAWYQFPIFHPMRDALTLSEHLLGISVIHAPLLWVTGNPLTAYNVTVLLSYVLCGLAMYALVWRLTRSGAAAFLAGLAYAFAPYRVSQLPHVQMLVTFWMPVALLGLHAYVTERRVRWLVVFGAAWLLQGASNGYALLYFTCLLAAWVVWFLAARGRWRETAAVALAAAAAVIPLAPVLMRYAAAQRALGLSRNIGEIDTYSADIAGLLCAPQGSTVWGWLRTACGPEGELFPGAALVVLAAVAWTMRQAPPAGPGAAPDDARARVPRLVNRSTLLLAGLFTAVALWTFALGPWRLDLGVIRASAASADKPTSIAAFFLMVAWLSAARTRSMIRRASAASFYGLAALACWVLTWGPFPRLLGDAVLYQAPYAWLLQVPGVDAVRAPARFWMLSVLCLAVAIGIGGARLLAGRSKRASAAIVGVAALGLAADGWTTMRAAEVPPSATPAPPPNSVALALPMDDPFKDIGAIYHAVRGRYRSVNGYSGYEPPHYEALRTLAGGSDPRMFAPFVARAPLDVLVGADSRLRRFVEEQPGAAFVAGGAIAHLRLPANGAAADTAGASGTRLDIQALHASCSSDRTGLATDGDVTTAWWCGSQEDAHVITADLGRTADVAAVVHALGSRGSEFPRALVIETSRDNEVWEQAWEGSPAWAVLQAALAVPRETRARFTFAPRSARYVRLRQAAVPAGEYYWSIAELEIWSGAD